MEVATFGEDLTEETGTGKGDHKREPKQLTPAQEEAKRQKAELNAKVALVKKLMRDIEAIVTKLNSVISKLKNLPEAGQPGVMSQVDVLEQCKNPLRNMLEEANKILADESFDDTAELRQKFTEAFQPSGSLGSMKTDISFADQRIRKSNKDHGGSTKPSEPAATEEEDE